MQRRKRQREEEEREKSKRIALENPLAPAPAAAAATKKAALAPIKIEAPQLAELRATGAATLAAALSPKANVQRSLPAPLTWAIMHKCLDEVATPAGVAIQRALDCWRRNTLGDEDLLAAIRCHSAASPALSEALKTAPKAVHESEVASSDDMAALLKLSAGAISV